MNSQLSTLNSQLVPVLRGLPVQVQPPPPDELKPQTSQTQTSDVAILDFISSDETLDRFDEVISASGWKLDSYLRNPVFQNAHQHGDILFTLGKALVTEVRTIAGHPALFQRIEFAVEANPIARLAFKLYQGGFLRAVSVGFIPIRWEDGGPGSAFKRKYLEQELVEVSAVSIPANPNALALALKSGAVEKSALRDLADLCALTLGRSAELQERAASRFRIGTVSPSSTRQPPPTRSAEFHSAVSPSSTRQPPPAAPVPTPQLHSLAHLVTTLLKRT